LYDSIDAGNLAFPWEYGEAVSISSLPSEDGEWRLIYPPDNSDGNIIVESGNVAGRKHAPLLNPTWDELVSANQNYLPNDLMSEGLFSFEYWLEIGMEPTEFNFNLMMYNGTRWEFLGPEWIFVGSSSERLSAFLLVPEWARGIETEIFFMALDRSYSAFPDYWN
nr:hypothetical protein [Desulfobacterales bacterium]